jgi:hypothetical protein
MKRLRVSPFKLIVHHSINTERSIPAKRRVHNVSLDDSLIVVALSALALALALGPAPDALPETGDRELPKDI